MSEKATISKSPETKNDSRSRNIQKSEFSPSKSVGTPIDQIMFLQRTVGNQAVQRMLQGSGVRGQQSGASGQGLFKRIQAKLKIGQPNDKYEQEADRVAVQVMRMEEGSVQSTVGREQESGNGNGKAVQTKPLSSRITPLIQRQTEEEDRIQEKAEEITMDGPEVQTKPIDDEGPNVQLRNLEMERTEYPILFKKAPNIQRSSREGSGRGTRKQIVEKAQKMVGKIEAKKDDGSGRRVGAEHLLEIFHLAAGDAWSDEVIENVRYTDQFPHWCGIFSVYATKKAGIDLGFWQVGMGVSSFGTLEPTDNPQPGDIGYFTEKQHHCIIKAVNGDTIESIDGNSGNFSEVIERTRPRSQFHAFFTAFTGSEKIIEEEQVQMKPLSDQITPIIQRQVEEEEEELVQPKLQTSLIQRQTEEEEFEEDVQAKPLIQRQVDQEEEEDTVQAKELQAQKPQITQISGNNIQRLCPECEEELQRQPIEEETPEIMTKSETEPQTASLNIQNQLNTSKGSGSPLPNETRTSMESSFGVDFSGVRAHTNSNAIQMNQRINAQAFTHGSDVYFNEGMYNPNTNSGKHLLAHELTHVVQQVPGQATGNSLQDVNGIVRRTPDENGGVLPPRLGISVRMTGIMFLPQEGNSFKAGSKQKQAFNMVLFRLIGDRYTDNYANELYFLAVEFGVGGIGTLSGEASEGEKILSFFVPLNILDSLIGRLKADAYVVLLTQRQEDVLRYGLFAHSAWEKYHVPEVAREVDVPIPKWYTQHMFIQEISQRIGLLRKYIDALAIYFQDENEVNKSLVVTTLQDILIALEGEPAILEAIRIDSALFGHPMYQNFWPLPTDNSNQDSGAEQAPAPRMADEAETPNPVVTNSFFNFARTQSQLSLDSYTQASARKELLDRFERFLLRGTAPATGDQQLTEEPGTANTAPHNSRMSVSPGLSGPPGGLQLEASEAADYRFIMSIIFPSVFDAFKRYYFEWNYVRVPDEQLGRPVDYDEMEQHDPSMWDVASNRYARAGSYAVEDVQTLFESLGPFGIGAVSLVAANAILRFIGTGLRLGFEILTMPDSEKLIQFPAPGVYMVRCKAIPDYDENAELVRPPSVAFQPIIVRDPLEMIRSRVDQQLLVNQASHERMAELRELLAEPICYENEEDLKKELEILELSLSSVGGSLEVQKRQLEELINDPNTRAPERERAQKQLENLNKIIKVRNDRAEEHDLTGAEPLIASFVSDTGQSIRLTLEAVDKFGESPKEYWVSDLTTPNSSQATGYGADRKTAILDAIEKILEGTGGYGRGYVAVSIDGVTYNRRIASSLGNLFMEAVENVATVLSLAAVVAAPFTGGSSLALLLPIGVVGAVPSAYRLINRSIDNTLRFDMAAVMDVINIAGGLVGLGHATVPLKMVQTGRVLYVMGLGIDGLGVLMIPVGVVSQIMELEGLLPGEKAARIMEILGQAMLNVGIMVGGIVADRARQRSRDTSQSRVTDSTEPGTSRSIDLTDLPDGRRALTDIKSEMFQLNGNNHQVSVTFKDGNLYIRICSDCGVLIQRLYHMLQDTSLPPDLRTNIRELRNSAESLQTDINLGRRDTESTEVQTEIDNIAQNLADMAGNHPSYIEPIVTPAAGGSTLTPLAINEYRGRIEVLGRRPGNHEASIRALEVLDNEVLPRADLTDAEKMMLMGRLIEVLMYKRAPTRDRDMVEVDMTDPAIRALFEESIANPNVESVPAWQDYMDIVRSKYFGRSGLLIGRSQRTTDKNAVPGTNAMRAAFIDGMNTGTVLPETAVTVRRHLDRAIRSAGSPEAAVALGDAVWIDGLRGNRIYASDPNAVLWPADPIWGVWRVDHIVELQHGGVNQPHNYVPVPQRMHGIKSQAMNSFGRKAAEVAFKGSGI